jgi:hypothetical protein
LTAIHRAQRTRRSGVAVDVGDTGTTDDLITTSSRDTDDHHRQDQQAAARPRRFAAGRDVTALLITAAVLVAWPLLGLLIALAIARRLAAASATLPEPHTAVETP